MDYLASLNDKQLEAVEHTEGFLRVIAGAGSGKTKLLVSRYAYLVKEYGIDSANILCVTFTNKAAAEMKQRIRALIGNEYDTSLICTYHGFCVRVLREDIEKIFYPKEFQIIDASQQKAILSDIYQKFELKLDHASFEKIIQQIALIKAKRSYVAGMCSPGKCQILSSVTTLDEQIIEEYLQRQKQIYAMDFSDLLYFTLDIFDRCPEVLTKWQDRLNYIQVDEFQDSSATEMELIDRLCTRHRNLMIVGDPDQNIYEWRGSDVRLLVDFDKTHAPTRTVFLNQNYRSTPQILSCANTLIEKNVYRLRKDLFTNGADGKPVHHYHTKSEFEEADKIVELIQSISRESGFGYSDFAVLYRSGFLSRVVEKKLTESGIPYEIFGGVKFYNRMEIQDMMAYLRLIAFDDDIAFKRIINVPRRRFGRAKLQFLTQQQSEGESLFQTLQRTADDNVLKNSGAKDFIRIIEEIRKQVKTMPLSEIVEKTCADTGYEQYIRELGDMERFENLSEFKRIATEYERSFGETVSLKEFINQLSMQSDDREDSGADMVKLMTVHASKGLEFPVVFILGFSEGIFPSSKTVEERKLMGLEEERRLCYVAITRAQSQLFLLDSEGFTQNSKQKLPSRFLKEIGEENYIRIGKISRELQHSADDYAAQILGDTPHHEAVQNRGDRVVHPAFGEGEILEYNSRKNTYRIQFDRLDSPRDISADFFKREHSHHIHKSHTEQAAESIKKSAVSSTSPDRTKQIRVKSSRRMSSMKKQELSSGETTEKSHRTGSADTNNLWEQDDVPKTGWICTGVTDLGRPSAVCEMCGHQIIRYVHHMQHPNYRSLDVGCICAGKMEGNIEGAKQREQAYKSKQSRKESFMRREWKISKSGNSYTKIKDHLIVLYYDQRKKLWKYAIDNIFCKENYNRKEECIDAAFEALENLTGK